VESWLHTGEAHVGSSCCCAALPLLAVAQMAQGPLAVPHVLLLLVRVPQGPVQQVVLGFPPAYHISWDRLLLACGRRTMGSTARSQMFPVMPVRKVQPHLQQS